MVENQSARYTLVPFVHNPRIDPGEEILIDVFIIGDGDVPRSQLFIAHSYPILVSDNIGRVKRSMTIDEGDIISGDAIDDVIEDCEEVSGDLTSTGGHYSFDERYLTELNYDEDEISKLGFPPSFLETRHDGRPPLRYRLPTDKGGTPGNYTVTIVFTYECEQGTIQQDRQDISIHVNNKREQWEPVPTIAGVFAAIIALFSLIIAATSLAMNAGLITL